AEDWSRTSARIPLAALAARDRQAAEKVRTFSGWLSLAHPLTTGADLPCADAKAAQTLERWLTASEGTGRQITRLFGRRNEPLMEELGRSLKWSRNEDWLTLQARAPLAKK